MFLGPPSVVFCWGDDARFLQTESVEIIGRHEAWYEKWLKAVAKRSYLLKQISHDWPTPWTRKPSDAALVSPELIQDEIRTKKNEQ